MTFYISLIVEGQTEVNSVGSLLTRIGDELHQPATPLIALPRELLADP